MSICCCCCSNDIDSTFEAFQVVRGEWPLSRTAVASLRAENPTVPNPTKTWSTGMPSLFSARMLGGFRGTRTRPLRGPVQVPARRSGRDETSTETKAWLFPLETVTISCLTALHTVYKYDVKSAFHFLHTRALSSASKSRERRKLPYQPELPIAMVLAVFCFYHGCKVSSLPKPRIKVSYACLIVQSIITASTAIPASPITRI